jgi:hypothetical protein
MKRNTIFVSWSTIDMREFTCDIPGDGDADELAERIYGCRHVTVADVQSTVPRTLIVIRLERRARTPELIKETIGQISEELDRAVEFPHRQTIDEWLRQAFSGYGR